MATLSIHMPIANIACQDLLNYADVVHSGHLRRRTRKNRVIEGLTRSTHLIRWSSAYVVVRLGCIYVYDDESSSTPSKASSLYGFTEVRACDPGEVPTEVTWSFKVISQLSLKNSEFYFSAANRSDMEKWVDCFQKQILFVNGNVEGIRPVRQQTPAAASAAAAGHHKHTRKSSAGKVDEPPSADDDDDYEKIEQSDEESNVTDNFKDIIISRKSQLPPSYIAKRPPAPPPPKPATAPKPAPKPTSRRLPPVPPPEPYESSSDGDYEPGSEYPQLTPPSPASSDEMALVNDAYWRGTSKEGESTMKAMTKSGTYMLRESTTESDAEILLVKNGSTVIRYRIIITEGGSYCLGPHEQHCHSLGSLIKHYKVNPLPRHDIKLTKPFSHFIN